MISFARLFLSGTRLAIGDPARAGEGFERVLRGRSGCWDAYADTAHLGAGLGERIAALTLVHGSHTPDTRIDRRSWLMPVDPGLYGFYDAGRLDGLDDTTYARGVLDVAYHDRRAFALDDAGVIARTGLGYGSYQLFLGIDAADHVIAARVPFLDQPADAGRA